MKEGLLFKMVGLFLVMLLCFGACSNRNETMDKEEKESVEQELSPKVDPYAEMMEYVELGYYDEAVEAICTVELNAEEIVKEKVYELASQYVNGQNREDAKNAYMWLGDYKDSKAKYNDIIEIDFRQWADAEGSILYEADNDSMPSNVTVPGNIKEIFRGAFDKCFNLNNVVLLDGVESIGEYAFINCVNLRSIELPSSVTSIGWSAFNYCNSLRSIKIPSGVEKIEDQSFYACFSLESVDLPDSVTSIGNSAFAYCSSLTSLKIPYGVKKISENAFFESNPNLVLQVKAGSYAQDFAEQYGITYETY